MKVTPLPLRLSGTLSITYRSYAELLQAAEESSDVPDVRASQKQVKKDITRSYAPLTTGVEAGSRYTLAIGEEEIAQLERVLYALVERHRAKCSLTLD